MDEIKIRGDFRRVTSGKNFLLIYFFSMIIFSLINGIQGQEDLLSLCRSASSRQSCGQCIKQNPACVWCTDPAFSGDYRCDVETNLIDSCPPQFLYQSKSNVQIKENVEAGVFESHLGRIRKIQPQVVHVLIKPGESVQFPLKYYHSDEQAQDVMVLNSETDSSGVTLTYSVDCKGVRRHDRLCPGVRTSDLIVYNVSVSIRGCSSNAVISIGLTNVREVLAVYVHPQCGCDCERPEKQEPKSGHCSGAGTLVCGACACDNSRMGGRHCECPLYPGQTTDQLEDSCRVAPGKPICSGHGYCNCGRCVCDQNQYSGRYCDCGYAPCPLGTNGQECGGRGSCYCGACQCESGWSGPTCECSVGTEDCMSDGKFCSGRGSCVCNKCKCVAGYEGDRCEHAAGHAPDAPPKPEMPTDDDDDQDDDDDDDDQDGRDDASPTDTPDNTDNDDQQQAIDQSQSDPDPDPESEPESEPAADGHEEADQAAESSSNAEPSADSQKESGESDSAISSKPISIFILFFTFILLHFVTRR